jgi:hypothetical protein
VIRIDPLKIPCELANPVKLFYNLWLRCNDRVSRGT